MKISTDMVRKAIRALGDGGREVSYRQVYEALGLSSEAEQAVVRSRAAVCSQSKPTVIWQVGALHPQSRSLLPLAVYTRGGRSAIRRGTNPGSQRLISRII